MAQQALTIAARMPKPATFNGTATSWRVLCDLYPSAGTPEVIGAVIDYCAVRKLDPFRRPVHVVEMWNRRLRRKVQVVMQGINEVEITASRTGKWAGMDPPKWGPDVERTFRGSFEKDDGTTVATEVTMRYPEWCMVTVYRLRGEQKDAFTEQLWFIECYASAGFRSEVPNERWQKAPRQMLHKCCKAAVLRAAFPEEGFDAVAEEMEGHETEGGYTIEGMVEPGESTGAAPAGQGAKGGTAAGGSVSPPTGGDAPKDREAARERMSGVYTDPAKDVTPADRFGAVLAQLDLESDGGRWQKKLEEACGLAANTGDAIQIATARSVRHALDHAPSLVAAQVRETLRLLHERLAPSDDDPADPLADLIAEVETMDLTTIALLPVNAGWRERTKDLFPMDYERLDEAIAERKIALGSAP